LATGATGDFLFASKDIKVRALKQHELARVGQPRSQHVRCLRGKRIPLTIDQ
jgi:hypothetical protein